MESIPLDMEDLNEGEDGYLSNEEFPPLAAELPPLSPNRNNADPFAEDDNQMGSGGGDVGEKETQGDKKRPRRVVIRKPQPKLDAARLCSDRGLPTLSKHFEKVKFKGKGHEVADLNLLMSTMEHWAHRLFPKMPFDEVIERIEKLGRKKEVQTCIKKIRLDMPLLDDEFEEENEDVEGTADTNADKDEMDAFSQLAGPSSQLAGPSSQATGTPSTSKVQLTDEQREKIERNKRLALERRKAKELAAKSSSQAPITTEEIEDLERNHAAGDKEMENEMWNDIALFEASQRNIWHKSPETKQVSERGDDGSQPSCSRNVDAMSKKGTETVDLTNKLPDTSSPKKDANVSMETIDVDADFSEDKLHVPPKDSTVETIELDSDNEGENIAESTGSEMVLKWDSESAEESMVVQEAE